MFLNKSLTCVYLLRPCPPCLMSLRGFDGLCLLNSLPHSVVVLSRCPGSSALLRRTHFRLELDELLGHLVRRSLGQDAHHRHARLVRVDAWPDGTPAHAALAVGDVSQLDHGHAHHPVGPAEAVVLHRHLELVAIWRLFTQDAVGNRNSASHFTASVTCLEEKKQK